MTHFCHRCSNSLDDPGAARCPYCGAERPTSSWPADPRLGQTVVGGQYRVLARLGAGGFGVVYLVETVVGGLRRALKVLHTEWASNSDVRERFIDVRERFINEAVVLEQVNHPNVARCHAVGTLENESALYLLLELVDGVSVADLSTAAPTMRSMKVFIESRAHDAVSSFASYDPPPCNTSAIRARHARSSREIGASPSTPPVASATWVHAATSSADVWARRVSPYCASSALTP
mgnify:CR=1 FL=1